MALDEYRFSLPLEVRFRDCDSMGHVNNAVYFTYFEQARFAYWRHVLQGRGGQTPRFILARAECDFKTPAAFGDLLDIRARVSSIGRTSFSAEYEILHARQRNLMASARSVQVMFDYAAGQPVPIPDDIRARIEDFEGRSLAVRTG